MAKNKELSTDICVPSFIYSMGLRGATLAVYAKIYTFTNHGEGLFFGTYKYLASAIGVCDRTVRRAISSLLSRGLIERAEISGKRGLKCTERGVKNQGHKKDTESESQSLVTSRAVSKKNDRDISAELSEARLGGASPESRNTYDTCDGVGNLEKIYLQKKLNEPKYGYITLGRRGYIKMTESQAERLAGLVSSDVLTSYFEIFEVMLEENINKSVPAPHSHYHTIKKWIEEDASV
jgi:hypothetical protein